MFVPNILCNEGHQILKSGVPLAQPARPRIMKQGNEFFGAAGTETATKNIEANSANLAIFMTITLALLRGAPKPVYSKAGD